MTQCPKSTIMDPVVVLMIKKGNNMEKIAEELFNDIREFRITLAEFKEILSKQMAESHAIGFEDGYHEGREDWR